MKEKRNTGIFYNVLAGLLIVTFVVGLIALCMYAFPVYNVWSKEKKGMSELKQAEWSKQIQIEEANANLEAERLNAQAEVARARGMAEAMEIENGTLTETYIKYLWVRGMVNNKNVVYIPTEASIPILEVADKFGVSE